MQKKYKTSRCSLLYVECFTFVSPLCKLQVDIGDCLFSCSYSATDVTVLFGDLFEPYCCRTFTPVSVGWSFPTFSSFIIAVLIKLFFSFSFLFFLWRWGPTRAMVSSFLRFLDHTQRRITIGRNPLDEWSARRRNLYLTTHNTHNRKTSMPPRWDSKPHSQQVSGRRPTP